ncbi:MAG: glycosyltransferase [Candidatus Rokubacteria bacterium]|nr:glycosyltransferase [Candidatus Rokubacteria bacterium]
MSFRTVFVAPRVPYPLDSGLTQRMFHVLNALTSLGPVDLVCYRDNQLPCDDGDLGPLRDLCDTLQALPYPSAPGHASSRSRRDVLRQFVISRTPHLVSDFAGVPLVERAAALAQRADLVWAERIFVAEWLTTDRGKTIVDLDDLESVKQNRRLTLEPAGPWGLALRLDNLKLRRLERRAPSRYARVVVCSNPDRRFFPARHRGAVLVVPNGVPARLLHAPTRPRDPASLVLVGTMRYEPNVDAAMWLVREILPRVAEAVPDVRLYLVGDDLRGTLGRMHDGHRIIVTGRVDDVAPYVSRATVSLAPLRVGGGTRIKILEAFALGTPVVSTSIGAEGLDVVPGRHLRIADTPESFAAAVVDLLRDPVARESLAEAGRRLVAEWYTWEAIGTRLGADLRELLAHRSEPAAAGRSRLSAW